MYFFLLYPKFVIYFDFLMYDSLTPTDNAFSTSIWDSSHPNLVTSFVHYVSYTHRFYTYYATDTDIIIYWPFLGSDSVAALYIS